jgi:hypothetical protein
MCSKLVEMCRGRLDLLGVTLGNRDNRRSIVRWLALASKLS